MFLNSEFLMDQIYDCAFSLFADRPAHAAHEDARGEAHHHGGAPVRDAAVDVVRLRIPVLDDVGSRRARCRRKVSLE